METRLEGVYAGCDLVNNKRLVMITIIILQVFPAYYYTGYMVTQPPS